MKEHQKQEVSMIDRVVRKKTETGSIRVMEPNIHGMPFKCVDNSMNIDN